jgi:thiamine biosynthesis protein ThiS
VEGLGSQIQTGGLLMNIVLNGNPASVDEQETLADILARFGIKGPVAALLNEEVIHKADLSTVQPKAGDTVEFLVMMGGG